MMNCCEDSMAMCRVVCPKPRRVAPLEFRRGNGAESKAGAELLGLILRKDEFKADRCATLSSSPPFVFGSPPCRTPNPVVQDAHFGVEKLSFTCEASTNTSSQLSFHVREQSREKQAAVRVEGFACCHCHHTETINCI